MKNSFPNWIIDKAVLDMLLTTKPFDPKPKAATRYYRISYMGHFSAVALRHLVNYYCTDLDNKLAFSPFKVGHFFNVKDSVHNSRAPIAGHL